MMRRTSGHQLLTNDGFGPQYTGKESMAEYFDNTNSLKMTIDEQNNQLVRGRVSEAVLKKLNQFKTRVTRKTPKFKFDILMSWLEQTTMDEVLERQAKSKRLNKLLKPSAQLEEDKSITGFVGLGLSVAKSCLIGQDPFGDEPKLPEACYKKAPDASTDEEVQVSEALSSAQMASATRTTTAPVIAKEYNAEGMLLKAVQKECRDLITVLIYYLVDPDLALVLRKREKAYRVNPSLRDKAPRGCMPWKEYKEFIKARLVEAVGWKELEMMCNTHRRDNQTPSAWLQTISRGREILTKFEHVLNDRAYVERALEDLLGVEVEQVEKAYCQEKKRTDNTYTLEMAQTDLRQEKWDKFVVIVDSVLINTSRRYKAKRKRDGDAVGKRNTKEADKGNKNTRRLEIPIRKGPNKRARVDPRKTGFKQSTSGKRCFHCHRAGLYEEAKTHSTEQCDPKRREQALKRKLKRKLANQVSNRNNSGFRNRGNKGREGPKCSICLKAGRPANHRESNCRFKTIWKGKKGSELKEEQRKFYNKERKSATTNLAKQILEQQDKPLRGAEEESDSEPSDHGGIPVCWMATAEKPEGEIIDLEEESTGTTEEDTEACNTQIRLLTI